MAETTSLDLVLRLGSKATHMTGTMTSRHVRHTSEVTALSSPERICPISKCSPIESGTLQTQTRSSLAPLVAPKTQWQQG
jgi:hypothetical protein